jgi:hypothetical protein
MTPIKTRIDAIPIHNRVLGYLSASIPHNGVTKSPTRAGIERKREKKARSLDSNSLVRYGPIAPNKPNNTKYDVDIDTFDFIYNHPISQVKYKYKIC